MAGNKSLDSKDPRIERALAYPFEAPDRSFVFVNGEALPIIEVQLENFGATTVLSQNNILQLSEVLEPLAGQLNAFDRWRAVLAVGSNKSVRRLKEKFGHRRTPTIIPTLAVQVKNMAVAYGALFAPYGSISATLMPLEGVTVHSFVNLLDEETYELLHDSEAVGESYDVQALPDGSVILDLELDSVPLAAVEAYVARNGYLTLDGSAPILLPDVNVGRPELERLDQRAILERVRRKLGYEDLATFVLNLIAGMPERAAIQNKLVRDYSHQILFKTIGSDM